MALSNRLDFLMRLTDGYTCNVDSLSFLAIGNHTEAGSSLPLVNNKIWWHIDKDVLKEPLPQMQLLIKPLISPKIIASDQNPILYVHRYFYKIMIPRRWAGHQIMSNRFT